jgi:hypothetical protein
VAARVVTERGLNRALLARQLLLDRSSLAVSQAVEQMGGIQAQYAPSSYVGLWSRLAEFGRERLDTALDRRAVVQGTLMRATIHVVSARDYWPLALAIRRERREWFLRVDRSGVTQADLERAAGRVVAALADGPLRRAELEAVAGPPAKAGVGLFLDLVRVPPSGTWAKRRADLYDLAERWVGPPPDLPEGEAMQLLVRRYLGAFGPAHSRDIASWAGTTLGAVQRALEAMPLRQFRTEGGEELVDLARAPLPDHRTSAPIRFLGHWDAVLLVHARRTQVLPERHRSRVFSTRNPFSVGTVLVDGAVAAGWRLRDGVVVVEEFDELSPAVRSQVRDEAERLTAFHA